MLDQLVSALPTIPREQLAAVQGRFYPVEVGKGVLLMEEGERDAALLFITEGRVAVRTGEFEIASAGAGGMIGEIAFFGGQLRIATVHAITPCVFVVLDRKEYDVLLDRGDPVAYGVERVAVHQMVGRLRDVDVRIADLGEGRADTIPPADETDGVVRTEYYDRLGVLQKSRLFADSPIGALDDVANLTEARRFKPGEALCRQGTRGQDLYFIADGLVDVVVREGERLEPLATLEGGDVVGMASVLQDRPRMASCVASTDVVALRMEQDHAASLVRGDTRAGSVFRTAMIRALGDQIAFANAQFAMLSLARKKRTTELLARLGIEAHGKHVKTLPPAPERIP